MSIALLFRFWREGAIALLALAVFGFCRSRDNALKRAGAAEALTQVVRDSLRSNAQQIRVWDTVYKRDTIRLARLVSRTDTLRDSVLLHLTDTVRVKEFVRTADSALKVCTETTNDCAKFRTLAEQRFNSYEAEIKALKQGPARQHWGLGVTAGVSGLYDFSNKKPAFGPGASLGFTYRW